MKFKALISSPQWSVSILTGLFLLVSVLNLFPIHALELTAYDLLDRFRKPQASHEVVIVAVDDQSVSAIGAWPWPRRYITEMIRYLSDAGAGAIGVDFLFSRPEAAPGLEVIEGIRAQISRKLKSVRSSTRDSINTMLRNGEKDLDFDARLAETVRQSGKVVLPIKFTRSAPSAIPGSVTAAEVPSWQKHNSLQLLKPRKSLLQRLPVLGPRLEVEAGGNPAGLTLATPFDGLANAAAGLGHINWAVDPDGNVRSQPLLIAYRGRFFPSMSLQLVLQQTAQRLNPIQPGLTGDGFYGLQTGRLRIPTDDHHRMRIDFRSAQAGIERISFLNVYQRRVPAEKFKDKTVLVGLTATGQAPRLTVAGKRLVSRTEATAMAVSNMLSGRHLLRPLWALWVEIAAILISGGILCLFAVGNRHWVKWVIAAALGLAWIWIWTRMFTVNGYWFKGVAPILLLICGLALLWIQQAVLRRRAENIKLNKMLGLSFQGQDMLDLAFDKFRKCPVEEKSVKALLYNLAVAFERKRMFNNARAVYNHLHRGGVYKDSVERLNRLQKIEETTLIFAASGSRKNPPLLFDNTTALPRLGRYEIIKQLGQGAMATVYLANDPKINREVALKTMKFGDVSSEELRRVKQRFFREAEAAGRLSHPKIVTIYDVGEDCDVAYMAMELIHGNDLSKYCKKGKLLSVKRALKIVASVAEALDYAHNHGIVHRDIKPANIMLLKNDHVKVADFGIARVMSVSKTKTGNILGTPSYMSPEQVAGKPVDGRSDLFSLGAVLYEMLTGEKPFKGENIAALIHSIVNADYVPLKRVFSQVPACCAAILEQLLEKDLDKRFKNAAEVAIRVQMCVETIDWTYYETSQKKTASAGRRKD